MSKLKYVKEFNKIVQGAQFLASSNDVSLSNKLILIQQDLCDEEFNFDSFDSYNFYSNIYNVLNHSSDFKSNLINGCIDVLLKSTNSRNRTLMKAMKFINFLPAIIKLVLIMNEENEEKLMKLLTLIKNLLRTTGELDEHNTKLIIELLRDHVENSLNENVSKLSLNILANLTLKNKTAKYHVSRIIKASGLQNKIDKSSDLVAAKFLAVIAGEIAFKDFPHLITLSFKSIQEGILNYDIEPIQHSLDLLECSKGSRLERNISDVEENMKYFEDLIRKLLLALEDEPDKQLKEEFFEGIFDYFSELLQLDNSLVSRMKLFTEKVFDKAHFVKSPKALDFLCTFINYCGKMTSIEPIANTIIKSFNEEQSQVSNDQKIVYLKLIQALHLNEHLKNTHSTAVLHFIDRLMQPMPEIKICEMKEDFVFLVVHLIKTLSVLSSDYQLFNEQLNAMLSLQYLPIVITNAYMSKDKSILMTLFSISCIDNFPNEKVAHLLSVSNNSILTETQNKELNKRHEISSSSSSKYINRVMGQELNDLISKMNEKLDNNEMDSLKTSDVISLYRHKNNYFNDHLNALNASLEKYTDLCNELQHQNAVLRKISEQQETTNWCFEMDKELLRRENNDLVDSQKHLQASILAFQNKITKENQSKAQVQKVLKVKEMEYESEYINLFLHPFTHVIIFFRIA